MVDAAYFEESVQEYYFFSGYRFARVDANTGKISDKIISGPAKIADHWPALNDAGFGSLDALLPVPGEPKHVWVFRGTRFARILVTPGEAKSKVLTGPANIADHWPSLVQAGFSTVDAILPVPGVPNEAYVFNQDKYARITLTPGKAESALAFGPAKISDHWPSLVKAGFTTIDAAIVTKGLPDHAWIFSDNKYVRVQIVPKTNKDTVIFGPASVQTHWPNLDWV